MVTGPTRGRASLGGGVAVAIVVLLGTVILLANLARGGDESGSPSPAGSGPSASASAIAATSPTATARPTPSPTPAPFDPATVSVTVAQVATVPGHALAITNAGDGSGRLFVADKGGNIFVVKDGSVLPTPMLDISRRVSGGGEQGLLGLAFHPDFSDDQRVFVDYTNVDGDTVVSSFEVDASAPDTLVPTSEQVILTVDQPFANHNGGGVAFGPDGYLYIALGDGGSGGDPQGNGQRLDTLLGKILRIDVDHPSDGRAYGIPAGNPFVGVGGARPEIWLTGLRNPFRFSFDRTTGDLWIGDVGQGAWEEVDVARAGVGGLNFGWNVMEGAHCYTPSSGCSAAGLTAPIVEYDHKLGSAIIGGIVYRGSAQPVLAGGYLFSDAYSGRIWAVAATAETGSALVEVGTGAISVAGYGEDEAGELYAADLDGLVYRVVGTAR